MNFKFAIAASALVASAGIFFMVGCGGTSCDKASDQLTACGVTGQVNSTSAVAPACSGSILCTSDCINKATCDQLTDAFSGMPSANNPFLKCTEPCANAK